MQTSNVKTTLLKLFSANKRFGKIRAAVPKNVVSGVSGSEAGDQFEGFPPYVMTKECKMARLEAELARARAEAAVHRTRQRIL